MKKWFAVFLSLCLLLSMGSGALADIADESALLAHYETAQAVAAEGIVLLENNGVLPMASSGNVALFGDAGFATLSTATDSTVAGTTFHVNISDALEAAGYTLLTSAESTVADELAQTPDYVIYAISRSSAESSDRTATAGDYYLSDEEISDLTALAETYGNVILVLNLCAVTDFYNTYAQINADCPDGIGAVVFTGIGGEGSGDAIVEVLNATVPVSGKLADTWALDYSDYPSAATFGTTGHTEWGYDGDNEYYFEGIFQGYRYFDTFNVPVAYAFGYGLSYTDLEISDINVSLSDDMAEVTVSATVTNTGDTYSGKETVQVYFSYDYAAAEAQGTAELETAYQELTGYAKTSLLAPDESETVEIRFDTVDMAAYDESADQYILQAGDYLVRVGNSSDNTVVAAVLSLDTRVVTEQCTPGLFEIEDEENIEGDDAEILLEGTLTYDDITLETLDYKTWETDGAQALSLDAEALSLLYVDSTSQYDETTVVSYISNDEDSDSHAYSLRETENNTGRTETYAYVDTEEGYTLIDVYEGDITMEQFVASLSTEELADIVTGLSSEQTLYLFDEDSELLQYVPDDVAGYQGTENLQTYRFIPHVFQSDGPEGAGVTFSFEDIWEGETAESEEASYQSIRLPSETVMAMTWNDDLVYALGNAVGEEMVAAGLSIWLAPGANIHRNPLNGRNYQYYSEDPYLTGSMLIAEVSGVQDVDGALCCVKHFATNNMETNRGMVNTVISERALREIYLEGWRMCATSENANAAFMTAYNQLNGVFCGESYDLCNHLVRGEWQWEGLIMDDYTPSFFMAWRDLVASIRVGNDLVMPGNTTSDVSDPPMVPLENPYGDAEYEGVEAPFQSDSYVMMIGMDEGLLLLGDLQAAAMNILEVYMRTDVFAQLYDAVLTYDIQPSMAD